MFGPGFPMIIYKCTLVMKNSVSILPTNPHISTSQQAHIVYQCLIVVLIIIVGDMTKKLA